MGTNQVAWDEGITELSETQALIETKPLEINIRLFETFSAGSFHDLNMKSLTQLRETAARNLPASALIAKQLNYKFIEFFTNSSKSLNSYKSISKTSKPTPEIACF